MSLTITRPDDWHVHLRDGNILKRVVPFSAAQFARILVMPNLAPPVATVEAGLAYRNRILNAVPEGSDLDPKLSLYLTNDTSIKDIQEASVCEHVMGFKLYPAGATTNSSSGVTRVSAMMRIFESMAKYDVPLQVHGEVADPHIDIFDREAMFIEQILEPIHREIPDLKIVLEHITTQQGTEFVMNANNNVAGTITPQHLIYNRNDLFRGGIRPHNYCLPLPKREEHRQALLEAATSGNPSFFLGTDSAPHTRNTKESDCGCAGVFSSVAAIEYYAEAFDSIGRIDRLENFASHFGADFYRLPKNTGTLTLKKEKVKIPKKIQAENGAAGDDLVPLKAGGSVSWRMEGGNLP